MREYLKMLLDLWRTRRLHPQWWKPSDRRHAERHPWPPGFGPDRNPVFARNAIRIPRPPGEVFQKLLLAEQWPDWYDNAIDVEIHPPPSLRFSRDGSAVESPVPARVGAGGEPELRGTRGVRAPARAAVIPGAGAPPQLGPDVEFSWTTFGLRVRSRVTEFEPGEKIAWTAKAAGVDVYHRWYFKPYGGGTMVITEECEKGPVVSILRWAMNRALHAGHQLWLESLRGPAP
jgi:hypothetical protein